MKKTSTSLTTQTLVKNAILLAITAFMVSAAPGSRGDAALCGCTRSWDNLGTGDWFNPSNWAPYHDYIPGCGEEPVCPIDGGTTEANINNGGEAQITSTQRLPIRFNQGRKWQLLYPHHHLRLA